MWAGTMGNCSIKVHITAVAGQGLEASQNTMTTARALQLGCHLAVQRLTRAPMNRIASTPPIAMALMRAAAGCQAGTPWVSAGQTGHDSTQRPQSPGHCSG
jgi:hypothetical protein